MNTRVITAERKPTEIEWDGKTMRVQQLSLRLPFARKPQSLAKMATSDACTIYVTDTVSLTPEAFDAFAANLLASYEWLRGKGDHYRDGRLCVEVCAPGRPRLYFDPSGGDYARYVATWR